MTRMKMINIGTKMTIPENTYQKVISLIFLLAGVTSEDHLFSKHYLT